MTNDIHGAGGGGGSQHTPVESPDSLRSLATFRILDLISEGEIAGLVNGQQSIFLNETPLANSDGSLNFQNVQVDARNGTQTQDIIKGYTDTENEIAVGVELKSGSPWVQSLSNTEMSAVRVTLGWPQLQKSNTSNGDINGYSISYQIDLQTDGGAWTTVYSSAVTGKTTTKYQRSTRIDLPPATTGWTIRVTRITPNQNSAAIADTMTVDSYTEVIDAKLRYPNSALIAISGDAQQFDNIPSRAYDIFGRIIQVPSNYDPASRGYTGTWDGTFKPSWTDNPAWVYYDLATNDRFGLGGILGQPPNKWDLYRIAQYCDELVDDGKGGQEPRFTFNGCLNTQDDAYKVLQNIASVFRAVTFWSGSSLSVSADMPADPVYVYTPANVLNGKFTYQSTPKKQRFTTALVTWNDPSDFYRSKQHYVQHDGGLARYGIVPTSITAMGCTSEAQAHRAGMWALESAQNETQSVTFSVGLDGVMAAPGQLIRIADPGRAGKRQGGRISSATATSIVVDRAPDVVSVGDSLTVILPSGISETHAITAISGTTLSIAPPGFTETPVADAVWTSESSSLVAQSFRVTNVKENKTDQSLTYDITAVQHVSSKYALIDSGTILPVPPISQLPALQQPPVASVSIASRVVIVQGAAEPAITISWPKADGALTYQVEWRRDDGQWISAGTVSATSVDVTGVYTGNYTARVRAISASGVVSIPTLSDVTAVQGKTVPPAPPTLTATGGQLEIKLSWTWPDGVNVEDTSYTEVWVSETSTFDDGSSVASVAYPGTTYTITGLLPEQVRYAWVRLVDKSQNVGPWSVPAHATGGDVTDLFKPIQDQVDQLNQDVQDVQGDVNDAASAIQQETQDRIDGDAAEAQARAQAITAEQNARAQAIQDEADARIQGLQQEASDRADAIAAEAAARGAAITDEATTRQTEDDSLSDRIDTATAAIGANTAAIQDEATARASADSSEANSRQLLATQMRGDYTGTDLDQVSSGLIASEKNARTTQYESLAQQMTLLSAGVGEQFDYDTIWYFDNGTEGWTGNGVPTWNQSWLRPANSTAPYIVSPLETTGIVSGAEYNQLRMRIRKTGAPTWFGKLWWKPIVAVTFGAPDGVANQFQLVDAAGVDVTSSIVVNAIYRTDWQGRQLLYPTARANYAYPSEPTLATLAQKGGMPAAVDDTIPTSSASFTPTGIRFPPNPTAQQFAYVSTSISHADVAVGQPLYFAALVKSTSSTAPDPAAPSGRNFGFAAFQRAITIDSIAVQEVGPNCWYYTGVGHVTATPNASDTFGVFRPIADSTPGEAYTVSALSLSTDAADIGAYIATTTAALTVTDYAVSDTGMISLGEVPEQTATLEWEGTGVNANGDAIATIAADFDDQHSIDITEPDYDGDGIGTLVVNTGWTDTVGQIKLQLTAAQTATDYDEIDWIAIGRPAPGASSAALANEEMARSTADIAEATARQTLSVKLVGEADPTGVTLDNIASGLLADEKNARVDADSSQVSRIETMEARMPTGNGSLATSASVSDEASARATADDALSTRTGMIEARMPAGNGGLATSASVSDEATARATADTALGTRIDAVKATADGAATSAQLTAEQTARASADGALGTRIDVTQAQTGTEFKDVFDAADPKVRWTIVSAHANATFTDAPSDDSILGGSIATATMQQYRIATDRIPFDPNKLYRFRVRLRVPNYTVGNGCYVGFAGYAADKTTLVNINGAASISSQHCSAYHPTEFTEYVGYLKGWAATGSYPFAHPDFNNPANANANVRYIAPLIYANHTDDNSVTDIDYFIIEDADASGQALTAQAQIATEQQARVDADGVLADRIDTVEATANDAATSAQLTAEQQARADADSAMASDIGLIGAHNADKTAFILNQNTVKVDGGTSFAQMLMGIQAASDANAAAASAAQGKADDAATAAATAAGIAGSKADVLVQSTEPAAAMQKATTLWIDTTGGANTPKRWNGSAWAPVTDKAATDAAAAAAAAQDAATAAQQAADAVNARVDTEAQTRADADGALSTRIDSVEATVGDNTAAIQAEQTARADGDSANAQAIANVAAQVDTFTAYYSQTFNGSAGDWSIAGASYEQFPFGGGANYGALVIHTGASQTDPNLLSPALKIGGSQANVVRAMIRIRTAGYTWDGQMFWTNNQHGFSGDYRVTAPDPGVAGQWVMVEWDASGISDWVGNTVTSIRLDFQKSANTLVDVAWVAIGLKGDAVAKAQATQTFQAQVNADGTAYAQAAVLVDANGHIGGTRLSSDGTTSSFVVVADQFGVFSPTGAARTIYEDACWKVYADGTGTPVVELGKLS